MSSSGQEVREEFDDVKLEVAKATVGGSAGDVDDVSTDISEGEKRAIIQILSQRLGVSDSSGVSVGSNLKDEMGGDNGHLTIIRNFIERREREESELVDEADTSVVEISQSDFEESAYEIADKLNRRIQGLSSDVNESQIYIISAKLDGIVEGEDRYVASVIKMKTFDAMGINRREEDESENETEGSEEETEQGDTRADFIPEIDQLDKILIYPHVGGQDTCLFAPFGTTDEDEDVNRSLVKFYQRSRSKYFEDFVVDEVRPNSKQQLKRIFEELDGIKNDNELTPSEFDQLFTGQDCITAENLIDVVTSFANIDDRDEARQELEEQLERPSLDAVSAEGSDDKRPGKTKYVFDEANTGEDVTLKYKSEIDENVTIDSTDSGSIMIEIEGSIDEIGIVDN